MPIDRFLIHPATITPRDIDDDRDAANDEVVVDGEPFDTTYWSVPLADGEGVESTTGERKVYLPADTAGRFDARAKIDLTADVGDYELVGEPFVWTNPRTRVVSHVTATVRRVA